MKLLVPKNTTSLMVELFIRNKTTGEPLTGLAFDTASLVARYYRNNASDDSAITLATMSLGTWASGGFKEIDAATMPGWYVFGIPDAALAAGADSVGIRLGGAANMEEIPLEIQLTDSVIQAEVWLVDNGGTGDTWLVTFYLDGEPITTGITSPTIQVVRASNGTDLIAETALTQIGSTPFYKKDEASNQIVSGQAYGVIITATIDGAERLWAQPWGQRV